VARTAGRSLAAVCVAGVVAVALVQTISFSRGHGERPRPRRLETLSSIVRGRELGWVQRVLEDAGLRVEVRSDGVARGLWATAQEVVARRSGAGGEDVITILGAPSAPPPLHISSLGRSSRCRPTPARKAHPFGLRMQASGPFLFGGTTANGVLHYGDEGAAFVYVAVAPKYGGPLLVRGRRVDGPGHIGFRQNAARGDDDVLLVGNLDEMHFPAEEGRRMWGATVELSDPGCYRIQFDGRGLSRVITFEARPEPPRSWRRDRH
jgi:hypothetical protein